MSNILLQRKSCVVDGRTRQTLSDSANCFVNHIWNWYVSGTVSNPTPYRIKSILCYEEEGPVSYE